MVVTLDADGQHLPEEMSRLVRPVLDGEVDVAHGSRVLGHAEPNHYAREMGIVFFNRDGLVHHAHEGQRLLERLSRGARSTVLPQLVLRQEQFHTSEFMIEAIKRGVPAQGDPDHRDEAAARPLEEAGRDPLRAGIRERDRPDLVAVAASRSTGPARPAPRRRARQPRRAAHDRALDPVPARGPERDRDGQHGEAEDDPARAGCRARGRTTSSGMCHR